MTPHSRAARGGYAIIGEKVLGEQFRRVALSSVAASQANLSFLKNDVGGWAGELVRKRMGVEPWIIFDDLEDVINSV
jgi:hypothetical protein